MSDGYAARFIQKSENVNEFCSYSSIVFIIIWCIFIIPQKLSVDELTIRPSALAARCLVIQKPIDWFSSIPTFSCDVKPYNYALRSLDLPLAYDEDHLTHLNQNQQKPCSLSTWYIEKLLIGHCYGESRVYLKEIIQEEWKQKSVHVNVVVCKTLHLYNDLKCWGTFSLGLVLFRTVTSIPLPALWSYIRQKRDVTQQC